MNQYSALLTDLDDTLLKSYEQYKPALDYTAEVLAERFNIDEQELKKIVYKERSSLRLLMPNLPVGHNRLISFRKSLDKMGVKYLLGQLSDINELFWDKFINEVEVFNGAVEALDTLRENGIKIIVVSDGELTSRLKKIEKTGLDKHIDDIVSSEEVIFEKPFGSIFHLALRKIDKDPDEVIMLGNHLVNDVHGAQQVGIRAGLFDPEDGGNVYGKDKADVIKPDFVAKNYDDLLKEFDL